LTAPPLYSLRVRTPEKTHIFRSFHREALVGYLATIVAETDCDEDPEEYLEQIQALIDVWDPMNRFVRLNLPSPLDWNLPWADLRVLPQDEVKQLIDGMPCYETAEDRRLPAEDPGFTPEDLQDVDLVWLIWNQICLRMSERTVPAETGLILELYLQGTPQVREGFDQAMQLLTGVRLSEIVDLARQTASPEE